MIDFEGTDTMGNHIQNFVCNFSYSFFLMQVSTLKILSIKLYYTLFNKTDLRYTVFRTSVT